MTIYSAYIILYERDIVGIIIISMTSMRFLWCVCDTIPDLRRAGVAGYSFSSTNWTILMDIMGNMNTSLSPPIMGLSTVMGL